MRRSLCYTVAVLVLAIGGTLAVEAWQSLKPTDPMRWAIALPASDAQTLTYRVYVDDATTPLVLSGVTCVAAGLASGATCTGLPPAPGWPTGTHSFVLAAVRLVDGVASAEGRAGAETRTIGVAAPPAPTNVTIGGGGEPPPPPPPPPVDPLRVTLTPPTGPLTGATVPLVLTTLGPATRVVVDVFDLAGRLVCTTVAVAVGPNLWRAPTYPAGAPVGGYRLQGVAFDAQGGRAESALVQVTVA